jgi:uncharacterized zinc-type alcohol dehydrogenase-like protein
LCHSFPSLSHSAPYPRGKGHDDCAGGYTNGGYSSQITVHEKFVYHVPDNISLEACGPLVCAGITTFSPLNRHVLLKGGGKGKKVGIVGFGGLGHMAVKLAKAMGCEVTVFSHTVNKKAKAEALGANLLVYSDQSALEAVQGTFDLIIDSVSVHHEIGFLVPMLKPNSTYCQLGMFCQPFSLSAISLIFSQITLEGSLTGGVPETEKMLKFCSKHNIVPDYKLIHAKDAKAHFEAMYKGTAGAERAVIDISTLSELEDDEPHNKRVRAS